MDAVDSQRLRAAYLAPYRPHAQQESDIHRSIYLRPTAAHTDSAALSIETPVCVSIHVFQRDSVIYTHLWSGTDKGLSFGQSHTHNSNGMAHSVTGSRDVVPQVSLGVQTMPPLLWYSSP